MRKTFEDFYKLYNTKFKAAYIEKAGLCLKNGPYDGDFLAASWYAFMFCVARTYGEFIDFEQDFYKLPKSAQNLPTLESILADCSDETTERLFKETQANFEGDLFAFIRYALYLPPYYVQALKSVWISEAGYRRVDWKALEDALKEEDEEDA